MTNTCHVYSKQTTYVTKQETIMKWRHARWPDGINILISCPAGGVNLFKNLNVVLKKNEPTNRTILYSMHIMKKSNSRVHKCDVNFFVGVSLLKEMLVDMCCSCFSFINVSFIIQVLLCILFISLIKKMTWFVLYIINTQFLLKSWAG